MNQSDWSTCKNILCIRPDNMGDLLMSSPAIRALKETFNCRITVLTSSMGRGIVPYISEIDECIEFNVPWVKTAEANPESFFTIVNEVKKHRFDAAVIFTVYSQNSLPAAMIPYLAGIPRRLAYCRENPYELLTDWVPDKEPYSFIQHQVLRDLELVATIGAATNNKRLSLSYNENNWPQLQHKLFNAGIDIQKPWLILHAGVSERKRQYPTNLWIDAGKHIIHKLNYQILITGSKGERGLTSYLQYMIGSGAFSLAGDLSLEEFILLIRQAPVVVSVNTATVHLAAALNTPVVVLYALSNPQHLPWMAKGKMLLFDIPEELRSKNEVIRYTAEKLHPQNIPMTAPEEILESVRDVLCGECSSLPEMIPLRILSDQEV